MKKLFPARKTLVCDIPAGDGKNENLFYSALFLDLELCTSLLRVKKLYSKAGKSAHIKEVDGFFSFILRSGSQILSP
jgi:hypothetical protein